jgi:hypothetical protein
MNETPPCFHGWKHRAGTPCPYCGAKRDQLCQFLTDKPDDPSKRTIKQTTGRAVQHLEMDKAAAIVP